MDRKIKKKKWTVRRIALISAAAIFFSVVAWNLLLADRRSKLRVDQQKLTVSTVRYGVFQDYIPRSGRIMPSKTTFIDAVEAGIVRRILVESGMVLERGDTILQLSNSNLQLEVMSRESALYEQINLLRNTRLQLQQNSLNLKQDLAEVNYRLALLRPQYERQKSMYEQNLIALQEFETVREEYEYNRQRKRLIYASYQQDSVSTAEQLHQIQESEKRMMVSLDAVAALLENLVVRSPINGQLNNFDMELGQSINQGERIANVDVMDRYKLRVDIDELYLPRVEPGLKASTTHVGKNYQLEITKVYPEVTAGVFAVDMLFTGEVPSDIKRGQTIRIRLELGNSEEALLLPMGSFSKTTGGNWVYVLESDGKAVKRKVALGSKNPEFYEVLSGLEEGDRVITSSYENFGDSEVLLLN